MSVVQRPAVRIPESAVVKVLVGVQLTFACMYLLVLVKLAIAGIRYGGFGFRPFGDDPTLFDPKDVFGLGIPEYILHIPLFMNVLAGVIPSAALLLAGATALVVLWRARAPRRWLLTVSTGLTLICAAIQVSPFHALLVDWMLD